MRQSSKARSSRTSRTSAALSAAPFEALEDRRMFVAVAGTAGADLITITQSGATINVRLNGVTTSYAGQSDVRVDALGGNDRVIASSALTIPVALYGGDGFDRLTGGPGHDLLDGGAGGDFLDGGQGNDRIYGLEGDDQIFGGLGDDMIYAGRGNDLVNGDAGNDYITGNGQPDTYPVNTFAAAPPPAALVGRRGLGDISPFYYTDQDVIHGGDGYDVVDGAGGDDAVYGDANDDQVYGGDGNDRVYGGGGNNFVVGGNGDDVLVTIGGGTSDRAYGQAGNDSFWMDDNRLTELPMDGEPAEFAGSNFHFVASFEANVIRYNGTMTSHTPNKDLSNPNVDLPDPIANTVAYPLSTAPYASFRNRPLFGPGGPKANDVRQGEVGDCYYMAGLSAVAKQNPNKIRQSVVDLGDGTYAVQFLRGGRARYYRVDGDLPVLNGNPFYADLGHGGSTWVAIMEKAFAYGRFFDGGTYAVIDGGRIWEPYEFLGLQNFEIWGNNATETLQMLQHQVLDLGRAVTVSTPDVDPPAGLHVVKSHVYSVDYVNWSSGYIVLRNPWGQDYYNGFQTDSNPNDGYIVLTASVFFGYFRTAQSSYV
jgi:hypothetical protein